MRIRNIGTKFAVIIVLLVLTIGLASTALLSISFENAQEVQQEALIAALEERGFTACRELAATSAVYLPGNSSGLQTTISDFPEGTSDMVYAFVTNPDGTTVLADTFYPEGFPFILQASNPLNGQNQSVAIIDFQGNQTHDFAVPIITDEGLVGIARVGLSEESITSAAEHLTGIANEGLRNAVIIFLIALAVSLLIALTLAKRMVKPIEDLRMTTNLIVETSNLDQCVIVNSGDEIEELAKSFNQMIENLKNTLVSRDLLEDEVGRRRVVEQQLRETLVELERSNKELAQFAYVASHDLQEPLRMVTSYLQLLEKRYKSKLDSDADDFINFAVDGATRMQRLINDILMYSRVTTKAKPFESAELSEIVDEALANLEVSMTESGAKVTKDILPTVTVDQRQFIQVFQNLIGNAIKYRSAEPPRIHIIAKKTQSAVQVSVRDNGEGIDQKYFERIFEMFQRLGKKDEISGSGIGLAIVKKIVERHGGTIWVESEPGKGSTFHFTIPDRKEGK